MAIYKSRLPNAYQEVEYIESSGTQYIDTGVIPNDYQSIKLNITFELTSTAIVYWSLFGAFSNGNNSLMWQKRTLYAKTNAKGINQAFTEPAVNEKHTFEIQMKSGDFYFTDNGTTLATSQNTYTGNIKGISVSLTLFGTTNQNKSYSKIFKTSIYGNGVIIRNFVPCYRKSDNEIGLYDLVNGVFYTNQGTGTFTKGNDVLVKVASVYQGTTRMTKIYKGEQCVFNDLPKGYTKCEYIESSGTEYIDTGIVVSNLGTTGAMELVFKPANGFTNFCIFGSYKTNNAGSFQAGYRNVNEITMSYGFDSALTYSVDKTIFNKMFLSNGVQKLNDVVIGNKITQTSITENTQKIYLFGRTNSGTYNYYPSVLKSAKIWDNGSLIRNFIPCLDTNGTPCLYDTVSKQPFYNQGSGTFKYKVKLPSGYQQVEYIESTGTQYIDSGISPELADHIEFKAKANTDNNGNMIFGSYSGGGYGVQSLNNQIRIFGYNGWTATGISITNDFELKTTDTQTIVNGTQFTNKVNNISAEANYYILAGNYGGTPALLHSGCRFYYCRIARTDGTLVRNFIPCYRISDNVIGLYDMINRKFYTNAGTGTFLKGADV